MFKKKTTSAFIENFCKNVAMRGRNRFRSVRKESRSPSAIVSGIMRKLWYERQHQEIQHVAADASKFQRSNHSSLDSLTQKVRNELNACGDVFSIPFYLSLSLPPRVTFSPVSLRATLSLLYHPRYQLSFSLSVALTPPLRTHNEHWTLETENMGDRKGKEGIAARGSADDYGVVNLPGSSAPSAVLCTASRWRRLKKVRPLLSLVSHKLPLFMFINWEIRYKCLALKRHLKSLFFSLVRSPLKIYY